MQSDLRYIPLIAVLVVYVVALFVVPASAEENRVTFPENYAQYVRYGIYDRGSSGEEAFAHPDTIALRRTACRCPMARSSSCAS